MNTPPMVDLPLLSIVIVHYNTPDFLQMCLRSIEKSSLSRKEREVIVVDNASKEDIGHRLKKDFPFVRVMQNTENTGFSHANNQAIRHARGRYILLLNPDTVVETQTLSRMVTYMEENPNVGAATCFLELPDGKLDDASHRGFPTPWNALFFFSGVARLFPHSQLFNGYHLGYKDLEKIHEIDSACGAFLLVRRIAGKEIDWLDEEYFWYGEDIDFCYRLKQKGWKIVFIPDVKTLHHKGVSSGIKKHSQHLTSADEHIRRLATKSRFDVMRIFYRKHYKDKYPGWLTGIVLLGIRIKERMAFREL